MKTWLITGASRRFALEIAPAAHEAGESVVATARKTAPILDALPGHEGRLRTLALDGAVGRMSG